MGAKKKYKLEFEMRSSAKILFSFISTASGLSQWFADNVTVRDGGYTFSWKNEQQRALLLGIEDEKSIKFQWDDDDPQCYFEMEVLRDDLTGDVALSVTDFSTDAERAEKQSIWSSQVDNLLNVIGS